MVYQLKKEQKKRQKERLKAQEASLIKQLEVRNHRKMGKVKAMDKSFYFGYCWQNIVSTAVKGMLIVMEVGLFLAS